MVGVNEAGRVGQLQAACPSISVPRAPFLATTTHRLGLPANQKRHAHQHVAGARRIELDRFDEDVAELTQDGSTHPSRGHDHGDSRSTSRGVDSRAWSQ
jgi:hypothetical protein